MDAQEIGRRLVAAHTAYIARSGRQPFLRMAPTLRVDTDGKVHAWINIDQSAYLRGTCDTFEGALDKLDAAISAMDAVSVDESRANYQAFAFDPTMGVAPVEDDAIEGEAEAQEPAAPQIEQKRAAPDPAPQEPARSRARQPAPKAAPRRPEPETHAEQSLPLGDPETGEISTLSADEVERLGNWTNTILADLEQGAAADEVRDMWGPQIDMIEASAPDLFAKINAAMEQAAQG